MKFDISKIKQSNKTNQYKKRINFLRSNNKYTQSIEDTVEATIENLFTHKCKSFVIYGEPQSGKTELMIALTAKLLDRGIKHILVLINDNVSLLNQNLDRFITASLQPVPIFFRELEKTEYDVRTNEFIVFCKKNQSDLKKFRNLVGDLDNIFIIDDEGDYATPNSKINKLEKSKINELIGKILGKSGTFIAVTATPSRIDLNNTFYNDNQKWVPFKPHPNYYGHDHFFPSNASDQLKFNVNWLPEEGDDPRHLREAFFRFLITVAEKNLFNHANNKLEEHFSFLVHTSGRIHDHMIDENIIRKTMSVIHQKKQPKYEKYLETIFNICINKFDDEEFAYEIISYIKDHINRHKIVIMNSKKDMVSSDFKHGVNPIVPFTICIGGNVVSRGVTFENLLSMFFTRNVKGKLQSDTYIQRARMFGNRKNVFDKFELSITEELYEKWWEAFLSHRISLSTLTGLDAPVWINSKKIRAVAPSSVDKITVESYSNEISFGKFKLNSEITDIYNDSNKMNKIKKLEILKNLIGNESFPKFIYDYVENNIPKGDKNIHFQNIRDIEKITNADFKNIIRQRGGLVDPVKDSQINQNILHYFAIFKNENGDARFFYKPASRISFLKRSKNNS